MIIWKFNKYKNKNWKLDEQFFIYFNFFMSETIKNFSLWGIFRPFKSFLILPWLCKINPFIDFNLIHGTWKFILIFFEFENVSRLVWIFKKVISFRPNVIKHFWVFKKGEANRQTTCQHYYVIKETYIMVTTLVINKVSLKWFLLKSGNSKKRFLIEGYFDTTNFCSLLSGIKKTAHHRHTKSNKPLATLTKKKHF